TCPGAAAEFLSSLPSGPKKTRIPPSRIVNKKTRENLSRYCVAGQFVFELAKARSGRRVDSRMADAFQYCSWEYGPLPIADDIAA
ncbi:MAG: hypothetical protein ACN6OP_29670, partial [Pseudomonadales bacterium]